MCIPSTLCVIHNFIQLHESDPDGDDESEHSSNNDNKDTKNRAEEDGGMELWNKITDAIWEDYFAIRHAHELESESNTVDDDENDDIYDMY